MRKEIEKNAEECYFKLEDVLGSENDYEMIIQKHSNSFVLFKKLSWENMSLGLANHKAIVTFHNGKVLIDIRMKIWMLLFVILYYVFLLTVSTILLIQENFSFLFFVVVFIIASFAIPKSKRRFRNIILNFIKDL